MRTFISTIIIPLLLGCFVLQKTTAFAQASAPAIEGTILLIKPNFSGEEVTVRENLINLGVCCYMGYQNDSEEHVLLVSTNSNTSIAEVENKVRLVYPNASIEVLSSENWFQRIGYRILVTGQREKIQK
ncbi:MAG: hypothetical protein NZ576_06415 [Bacteroidia bacterium]|nr:hypothetical protein [Bacteroidia bacterium]